MKPNPAIRMQFKARYLPVLVGLLFLLQLLVPYKGWMILLVGLGGAWLVSYLWALSLARGLELTREMRYGWAQVGDRIQERFELSNRGWAAAPWVQITDHSDLPGYRASSVMGLGGRALKHWFEHGVCERRGLYTLGPTSVESGDPFGFYSVRLEYPGSVTMVVMPPIIHLPAIDVAPGGRAGEGRHKTHALERAIDASGVRQHLPGDGMRWIHWPTTARRDALFVRTFDSRPSSDWWIFLDLNERAQAGEGQHSTAEVGIILAASLADRGLRSGNSVGLVAHGQDLVWLPPRLASDQRLEILRALALAQPGDYPLGDLLARTRSALGQRCGLVIITPDAEAGWLQSVMLLMRRGVVPTILLLDPASFGGRGDMGSATASLQAQDVTHYVITPDLLDRPEARPGRVGSWRRSAQGRWEPEFHPRELVWRELA